MVQPGSPQMTVWRMRIAWWITKAPDTLRICNNYCFSTATMVTLPRLIVTRHVVSLPTNHAPNKSCVWSKVYHKHEIRWFAFWDEFRTCRRYTIFDVVTPTPTKMQVFWDVTWRRIYWQLQVFTSRQTITKPYRRVFAKGYMDMV